MSDIELATRVAQAKATNPGQSVWVAANAGSGKTFVLSRRVIRLLLGGTDPARILCLTFTKAAAAEMARRVFEELGRWTTLSDAELSAAIEELEGRAPVRSMVTAARRLFARALDTPGGLKIQTIHAFCERLLHQFPFEANVAGHFEVLDDRSAKALKDEARKRVLAGAAEQPHEGLGPALPTIIARVSDSTYESSLEQFIDARDKLRGWIVAANGLENALADLRDSLSVTQSPDELRRAAVEDGALDRAEARRLIDRLSGSGPNDQKAGERLRPFVEADDIATRYAGLADFFFTDGALRKAPVTKKLVDSWPGLDVLLANEGNRLAVLLDRILSADLFEMSAAMLRLVDATIVEYERLKAARGVLDFEDLIVRTANLLARDDADRWVHYKLDRGIEHILVDEAQDTSPRQWQVIASLVGEFFAGEGAAGAKLRTLFAVGDEKQSIFSFQGAVPAWFARMQRHFASQARTGIYAWEDVDLHLSFRSVPKVLDAVDVVFREPHMHAGLNAEPKPTLHTARRHGQPGRVFLWPVETAPEKPKADNWLDPLDHLGEGSPEVRLARRLAATVADLVNRPETLDAPAADGSPRIVRPGEILILTRSRGALTDAINRELKRKGVPISGADRLRLGEHIAVSDLISAAEVALLPEDDLALAEVLKSPLVGLDEEALYRLAYGRIGTLWQALSAAPDAACVAAREKIARWRARADRLDPHAFFAAILAADGGRRAFLARLGAEADDVLDEFLAQALAYEQANIPSLQGFLAWLEATETEVKRDLDAARDEVRVMTVHGAKGLEADVVFLVDNGTLPVIGNYISRVVPLSEGADPLAGGPLVWNHSTPAMPAAVAARIEVQKTSDDEEYRRLLYVAMTRARDRLYVVGIRKQTVNDDRRWHPLVDRALAPALTESKRADGAVEYEWRAEAMAPPPGKRASPAPAIPLPSWLAEAASAVPAAPRRLTPSALAAGSLAHLLPTGRDQAEGLERGRLVHRLLQSLPDVARERRAEIAANYLAATAPAWPLESRAALVAEVLAVLDDPAFAEALSPGSRAEVEIAGRLGAAAISGRIDRLAVTASRVLIVDYKTNRPAPRDSAAVPPQYLAQLALYRAVLRRCYPDRAIAAALVWTDGPVLMPIPDEMLDLAEEAARAG